MSAAESFAKSGFAAFISSAAGRILRVLVGLVLIFLGITHREGAGVVWIILGMIPFLAGALNLCFISAILGGPLCVTHNRQPKPNP
jgi:hypothetical protein